MKQGNKEPKGNNKEDVEEDYLRKNLKEIEESEGKYKWRWGKSRRQNMELKRNKKLRKM